MIISFLKEYWVEILTSILVASACTIYFRTAQKEDIKRIILALVIEAEKTLGSGTGPIKYEMVVERLYQILPATVKFLITRKQIDFMIEEAVQYLKRNLAEGKKLEDIR